MEIAINVGQEGDLKDALQIVADDVLHLTVARFGGRPPVPNWPIEVNWDSNGPFTSWPPPAAGRYCVATSVQEHLYAQFVYQLAHELGHIWFHPCCTNAVIEAYAIALSLELLGDISLQWYRTPPSAPGTFEYASSFMIYRTLEEQSELVKLPSQVQLALRSRGWEAVSLYLRFARSKQDTNPTDRVLNHLGAVVLRESGIKWPDLVGFAKCALPAGGREECFYPNVPFDLSVLPTTVHAAVPQLGYGCLTDLHVGRFATPPRTQHFMFEEDGIWCLLVECSPSESSAVHKEIQSLCPTILYVQKAQLP